MTKKHMIRLAVLAVILAGITVAALAFSVDSTLAQGPGGNGRGGGRWGGQGAQYNSQYGAQANSYNSQYGTGLGTGTCIGCSTGTGNTYGAGMGMTNGANGQGIMLQDHTGLYNLPPASTVPLSSTEIAALQAGFQDEVNAYTTYQAVINQFGAVSPFIRIQSAEAQHMASLAAMFSRYGLTVPAQVPTVTAPQFATLSDACAAAAAAEVANFELYDQWISQVSNYPDLVQVFTSLRNVSEYNHLPAFEQCAIY